MKKILLLTMTTCYKVIFQANEKKKGKNEKTLPTRMSMWRREISNVKNRYSAQPFIVHHAR